MATSKHDGRFCVESSLDLLIVLLYAPGQTGQAGEPIDGITRLQKLMFLLQQGKGPEQLVTAAKEYLYAAYKMGPYSKDIYNDLEMLASLGFLRTTKLNYVFTDENSSNIDSVNRSVESTRYELVGRGLEAGEELLSNLSSKDKEGLVEFKTFFNSLTLRQLLIFVYREYPSFTSESEIKEHLGFELS